MNKLPILLNNVPLETREHIFSQQDSAPAYYAIIVKQHLNQMFLYLWIGIYSVVSWLAQSSELSPLNFFYGDI